jgi:hypothetical protein
MIDSLTAAGGILMNPVYTFGNKLAELTKKNNAACVGLICLAIRDAGKDPKSMNYVDFEEIFQQYLPRRLEKMKIGESEKVTEELMEFLNQKQSLFTMMAR